MITIHVWTCENCDTKLYLKVDDEDFKHKLKLLQFATFVTQHCIDKNHNVIHKQKEDFKIKYV